MVYRIPIAQPSIDQEDIAMVTKALQEKRLSMGQYVEQFEDAFARFCGVRHAVATSSGTASLHLATAAINIGRNDEVLVPSFSYVATSNCALYQGGKPVFVDIEPVTYNMDPDDVEKKITSRTKAIIVVHYAGQCADMDPILEIARRHRLKVIEDAAEAHGAEYKGRKAGSLGDIACFSFTANKNMTTGEGGMVTTNDKSVADRIRLLRTHGQSQPYYHVEIGYNYRITDFQAALGLSQLKKLPAAISKKRELANRYTGRIRERLAGFAKPPTVGEGRTHTYMLYTIRFRNRGLCDHAIRVLEGRGIQTRIAFPPIHRQPQYLAQYSGVRLPNTERIAGQVLSVPIFISMSDGMQDEVIEALGIAGERFTVD